jgi:hypothetical protein
MNVLSKLWNGCLSAGGHAWSVALNVGWSVWHEVTDGVRRLSWWLLLGIVWIEGALVAHWLL